MTGWPTSGGQGDDGRTMYEAGHGNAEKDAPAAWELGGRTLATHRHHSPAGARPLFTTERHARGHRTHRWALSLPKSFVLGMLHERSMVLVSLGSCLCRYVEQSRGRMCADRYHAEHPAAQPATARHECAGVARAQATSSLGTLASWDGALDARIGCMRPSPITPPPCVEDGCPWGMEGECIHKPSICSCTQHTSCHVHFRSPTAGLFQLPAWESPPVRSQRAHVGAPGPWTPSAAWDTCWSCRFKWIYKTLPKPSWQRTHWRPGRRLPLARPRPRLSPSRRSWPTRRRLLTPRRAVIMRWSPPKRRRRSSARARWRQLPVRRICHQHSRSRRLPCPPKQRTLCPLRGQRANHRGVGRPHTQHPPQEGAPTAGREPGGRSRLSRSQCRTSGRTASTMSMGRSVTGTNHMKRGTPPRQRAASTSTITRGCSWSRRRAPTRPMPS